jgi:NAD(P)-dependent dehydrogenase (short-subunit alcohol dehydrogenase family)
MARHIVITGANRGIGLALCRHYVDQGARVTAVCRRSSDDLSALPLRVIDGCDLAVAEGVARVKQQLNGESIDILINNAGILRNESLSAMDFDAITEQFAVNAVAPLRVVVALQKQLVPGAKLALITSRMGSVADNGSGGYYGYRMSKAALNIAGVSLAQDLKARGIAVAMLHPGMVQTEMINYAGDVSAEVAAGRLAQRIEALTMANSGGFWHANGESLPW